MPDSPAGLQSLAHQTPVLQVPISALAGESRCKACSLFWSDPDAFVAMTGALVSGETLAEIVADLERRGHKFTESMLSRHKGKHLKPALWQLAQETKSLEVLARMALDIPSGDLAVAMVRLGCGAIIEGLKEIRPEAMRRLAKDDPVAYLAFTKDYAKAIASVQSLDRQAALNEAKLGLERLKLEANSAALLTRAMQALHRELSSSPDGLKLLSSIQAFVDAPKP